MKFCINCKYHKPHKYRDYSNLDECLCPDLPPDFDRVTGQTNKRFCSVERMYENRCGKNARFYVEKEPSSCEEKPKSLWDKFFR